MAGTGKELDIKKQKSKDGYYLYAALIAAGIGLIIAIFYMLKGSW